MTSTAIRHDDFDALVVAELKILWEGEQRLGRLYPQLRKKPQLHERFSNWPMFSIALMTYRLF